MEDAQREGRSEVLLEDGGMQEAEVVEVVVGLNLLAAPSSRDAIGRGKLAALPLPRPLQRHTPGLSPPTTSHELQSVTGQRPSHEQPC